jgi:cytochrome c-type biogenesis protein CcmH
MLNVRVVMLLLALLWIQLPASAAIDAYPFPDDAMRHRYTSLIAELRCPQCLNTNIAGSDAMIARDLRREVHRLVLDGQTDDQIREFMLARYGDFILYKPQLRAGTLVLWFGPLVFLLIALVVVFRLLRRRGMKAVALSDQDQARLKQLLTK